MQNLSKKCIIKIPSFISFFYSSKNSFVCLSNFTVKKSLKLKAQLFLFQWKNTLKVSFLPFFKVSINKQKKIKICQGTVIALIRRFIIEITAVLYQNLKIIGVGFRVFNVNNFKNKLLLFKLGYSHFLYFKFPARIQIFCLKTTKLFVYGNSYQEISKLAALIRSFKVPEPYKGKGISYETEKILLKEGKKI